MNDRANELKEIKDSNVPPKQKLLEFLTVMSDITLDFSYLTKPTMAILYNEVG